MNHPPTLRFADRLAQVETSAIRELFKLLGQPGIISLAGGFPDAALFDVEGLSQASARALAHESAAALQYGATEGYAPLRTQLARYLQGRGVAGMADDQLIVTTGSQQALDLIGKTLISPGDKVIVEAPTFLATIQCFRLYGAELVTAPIDANGVDEAALEALVAEHKPKFIYLVPTFGNPSGTVLSRARRLRVLELARRTQTLVVEDDPYGELYFQQPPPPSLLALSAEVSGSRDWLLHCGSLSKVLSPGLRIGWLVAPSAVLAKAVMCKQFSDAHTSTLAQAIAAQYLSSGRLEAQVARMRSVYAERALALAAALERELGDALTFTPPQGGLFIWARLSGTLGAGSDAAALARAAIAQGVAFVPGAPFYASQPDAATLRLSFATADRAALDEAARRLARALKASAPATNADACPAQS